MFFELKTYTAHPGKGEQMKRRFVEHSLRLFRAHGIHVVGYWSMANSSDQMVYVTQFADQATRDAAWKSFLADDEWKQVKTATETNGPSLKRTDLGGSAGF